MNVPRKINNRSPKFLGALPMYDVDGIKNFVKTVLKEKEGNRSVRIRGRHSNRKALLGKNWYAGTQNDIPWKQAEWVAFYAR